MKDKAQQSANELRTLFSEADNRLKTAQQDTDRLLSFISTLHDAETNMKALMDFYHSDVWMESRETLSKHFPGEHFESAGEDSIWNVSQELYFLKIKLIKLLADSLYADVPDDMK